MVKVELETPALLDNKVNQEMLAELEIPVNQVMRVKRELEERGGLGVVAVMVGLLVVQVMAVLQEVPPH